MTGFVRISIRESYLLATLPKKVGLYCTGIFVVRIQNLKHRRSATHNPLLDKNQFRKIEH